MTQAELTDVVWGQEASSEESVLRASMLGMSSEGALAYGEGVSRQLAPAKVVWHRGMGARLVPNSGVGWVLTPSARSISSRCTHKTFALLLYTLKLTHSQSILMSPRMCDWEYTAVKGNR